MFISNIQDLESIQKQVGLKNTKNRRTRQQRYFLLQLYTWWWTLDEHSNILFFPLVQCFYRFLSSLWLVIWGMMWWIRNVYWQKQVSDGFFSQVFHPKSSFLSCASFSGLLLWLSSPRALGNLLSHGIDDAGIHRLLLHWWIECLMCCSVFEGVFWSSKWGSLIYLWNRKKDEALAQKHRV